MEFPLGGPPYSAASIADLLAWASAHEKTCSAAELSRLEHLATEVPLEHLASLRTDCGRWLYAMHMEAAGRFEEAAEILRLLREKTVGEERALIMLASARNLLAAGFAEQVWYPLSEACKSTGSPRTLRNAARLLASARK